MPNTRSMTPTSMDLTEPPASFTVTGSGFANLGFGLPVVNFTRGGTLLAQARATALTGSTTLTVPFPTNATSLVGPLPGLSAGAVTVQVYNQTGPNAYLLVGSIPLTVEDHRPCPLCVTGITPNSIDLASPPATFSIAGQGFESNGFGLPVGTFIHAGHFLAQAGATALTSSTSLTVPLPTNAPSLVGPLPGLSAGPVSVQVYNQTGPNTYPLVRSIPLTVLHHRPPPPVPGITPNPIDLASPPEPFSIAGQRFES